MCGHLRSLAIDNNGVSNLQPRQAQITDQWPPTLSNAAQTTITSHAQVYGPVTYNTLQQQQPRVSKLGNKEKDQEFPSSVEEISLLPDK